MTWFPWRKTLKDAEEAVRHAEALRQDAETQRSRAEAMTPRVDAVSTSLRRLRTENHFGPLIDSILRGNE